MMTIVSRSPLSSTLFVFVATILVIAVAVPDHICAKLTEDVYKQDHRDSFAGANFFLETPNSGTGYFARAHYLPGTRELVVTHRGSWVFEDFTINTPSVVLNLPPVSLQSAKTFLQQCLQMAAAQKLEISSITHTGHSLGGVIGIMLAYRDNTRAVVFDTPGTKGLLLKDGHSVEKIAEMKDKIHEYLGVYNFVNSNGEHVGHIYKSTRVSDMQMNIDSSLLEKSRGEPIQLFLARTYDSHNMRRLCMDLLDQVENSVQNFQEVQHWPSELTQAVFCYFLNYRENKAFWDKAFETLRAKDPQKYSEDDKRKFIRQVLKEVDGNKCSPPSYGALVYDTVVKQSDKVVNWMEKMKKNVNDGVGEGKQFIKDIFSSFKKQTDISMNS
eukprot:TRINITY_DN9111_c0_g1_i1.p1 TRINITY_DN9111_c0_g1~~TRINITY_DN9111_c0_g1_i1.p1  ORF type:complete len:384 (-),score=51.00 TRINITY_DN9111_c0_g1_i1:225-1376(-)